MFNINKETQKKKPAPKTTGGSGVKDSVRKKRKKSTGDY